MIMPRFLTLSGGGVLVPIICLEGIVLTFFNFIHFDILLCLGMSRKDSS